MSEASQGGPTKLQAALGDAFHEGWRRRAAEDQHEPALEQLAACAEGRLTPAEEAQVAREIAASPAALEILAALIDDPKLWRRLPSTGAEIPAVTPVSTLRVSPRPAAQRDRRRTQLAAWAVAASLAFAAWGVVSSRNLRTEVAALSKRADGAATALLLSEETRIAELAQAERFPYIVGHGSAEWAALAEATVDQGLRQGGVRGGPLLTDEDAEAIERAENRLYAAAQEFGQSGLSGQLEYAAALIQAGRLDEARDLLDQIEESASEAAGTRSQWQNLQGSLLATEAADASMRVAEPLLAEAETLFRLAAEGGLNDAWLNLALVHLEQGEQDEAQDALDRYRAGAPATPSFNVRQPSATE